VHVEKLKIIDFGMAKYFRDVNRKMMLLDLGSPRRRVGLPRRYQPPEIYLGAYHAEPYDIWRVGLVLVQMLASMKPWDHADECVSYPNLFQIHFMCFRDCNEFR
jgi:serine/threonine protein kinase